MVGCNGASLKEVQLGEENVWENQQNNTIRSGEFKATLCSFSTLKRLEFQKHEFETVILRGFDSQNRLVYRLRMYAWY